jgi:cell division protein FtsA
MAQAEDVKKQQGYAIRSDIASDEYFSIRPFGEDHDVKINRQDLAHIIEARIEETFRLILQEVKRSGYDGLLPAGMVLTGGTSALPGIKQIASEVLGMSVRTAQPENLTGLVDKLGSPAYSTSVGLLRWATTMRDHDMIVTSGNKNRRRSRGESSMNLDSIKNWMKRLLP